MIANMIMNVWVIFYASCCVSTYSKQRQQSIICLSLCVYILKTKTTVNSMPLVVCLHTQNKDNSKFYASRCVSTYLKQRQQSILCLSLCVYIIKTKTTVNSMPLIVCLHTQNKDNSQVYASRCVSTYSKQRQQSNLSESDVR